MTQQIDNEALISKAGIATANSTSTPYHSGHPVDAVPDIDLPLEILKNKLMQELVGSTKQEDVYATRARLDRCI